MLLILHIYTYLLDSFGLTAETLLLGTNTVDFFLLNGNAEKYLCTTISRCFNLVADKVEHAASLPSNLCSFRITPRHFLSCSRPKYRKKYLKYKNFKIILSLENLLKKGNTQDYM